MPHRPPRNRLLRAGPIVCVTCCAILEDSRFAEEKRFDGEAARRTRTVKIADNLRNFTTDTNAQRNVGSVSVITARFVSVDILFSRVFLTSPNYANRVAQYKKISRGTGVLLSRCLLQASGDTVVRGRMHPIISITSMGRATCSTDPRSRSFSLFTEHCSRVLKELSRCRRVVGSSL